VREQDQTELRGRVEERQEAVVAGVEALERGVELQPAEPQGGEVLQPRDRVLAVRVDAAEPDEPPARLLADRRDLRVVERLALRVPPEQHTHEIQALVQRDEVLDRRGLGL